MSGPDKDARPTLALSVQEAEAELTRLDQLLLALPGPEFISDGVARQVARGRWSLLQLIRERGGCPEHR